jgi:hypothetical protein
MSTSITPGKDLFLQVKVPAVQPLFTTFAAGHFVKPGRFTQPVKAVESVPATFFGCYSEVYTAAPLDLDYEEPNACVDADYEVVQASAGVQEITVAVTSPSAAPSDSDVQPQRAAA